MPIQKQKPKLKKKSYYVKKLDEVFSRYIRLTYANDSGYVACYTCDKVMRWDESQNGHYISRGHMTTRWDESNCRVQCPGCNVFKNGNYTEYAYRLFKEVGQKGVDELMRKKKVLTQFSIPMLQEKTIYYTKKVKSLWKG